MSVLRDWLFGTEAIEAVQRLFGLGHPLPFRVFSLLGDTWGMILVVGLGFWLFGRRTLYALVSVVVAGAAAKLLLSSLFGTARPEGPEIVVYEQLQVSSFPSGHVFAAVGPWGLLYALGCVPLWAPVLVALLVGLGRMYLGVHFLADVLAGFAFGALFVWLFARLWPAARRWLERWGWAFYLALSALVVVGTLGWMIAVGGNPRRYEIFGMAIAAALGLPLERRWLRYRPALASGAARAGAALVGLFGVAALLLLDRGQGEQALLLGTLSAGAATLWAVLGAPALFVLLGLGGREAPAGTQPAAPPAARRA